MEITCYRDTELARESRFLPAATYNLAHTLLARNNAGCLFVPIRSMQYLAILDAEEFVFLDGERKCWIDIAWQNFRPQSRTALDEPVPYQAVFYNISAEETTKRLQHDFGSALQDFAKKDAPHGVARILKFNRSKNA
ncbi:MAG: hypothetical protein EPO42_09300 [Gallionellaceae bacterium]|nr:MAG: hypothetical protein EPO42_09300 [Gallionellaceae bacterium]